MAKEDVVRLFLMLDKNGNIWQIYSAELRIFVNVTYYEVWENNSIKKEFDTYGECLEYIMEHTGATNLKEEKIDGSILELLGH